MTSSTCKSEPIKRLSEFLKEQQEPYTLDICRSKGVAKSSRREDVADRSEQKKLEATRSRTCNPTKRMRNHKSTSRILKLITNKFISYTKYNTHFSRNSVQTEKSVTNSTKENLQFVSMGRVFGAQQVQNSEVK